MKTHKPNLVLATFVVLNILSLNNVQAQLSSDSAEEGPCLAPPAQRCFVTWLAVRSIYTYYCLKYGHISMCYSRKLCELFTYIFQCSMFQLFGPSPFPSWYIPMAHSFVYRKYAETLLGRPPADQTELSLMNLQLNCILATCEVKGYQNVSTLNSEFSQIGVPTLDGINLGNPALIDKFAIITAPSSFG